MMKYKMVITNQPKKKSTLLFVNRKGNSFIEVGNNAEVELTQAEMISVMESAGNSISLTLVPEKAVDKKDVK